MFLSNVFLCVSDGSYGKNVFECKKFKEFKEADEYFTKYLLESENETKNEKQKSTMISSCAFYVPEFVRIQCMSSKLKKLFGEDAKCLSVVYYFGET